MHLRVRGLHPQLRGGVSGDGIADRRMRVRTEKQSAGPQGRGGVLRWQGSTVLATRHRKALSWFSAGRSTVAADLRKFANERLLFSRRKLFLEGIRIFLVVRVSMDSLSDLQTTQGNSSDSI